MGTEIAGQLTLADSTSHDHGKITAEKVRRCGIQRKFDRADRGICFQHVGFGYFYRSLLDYLPRPIRHFPIGILGIHFLTVTPD